MQAIPAIRENSIAPSGPASKKAPAKNPAMPAIAIITSDTTVLNLFINLPQPSV